MMRPSMDANNATNTVGWNSPHFALLAFCGGVISLCFFAQLPPLAWTGFAALILLLISLRWACWRAVAALAVGLCWANIAATANLNTALPRALEKQDVVISGQVVGIPKVTDRYQRFDFAVQQLHWQGTAYPSPGKIRLMWYHAQPQIRSGQRWRFTARLKQARGYQNPGASFNYETYLFQHRLRATGYVRAKSPPVLLAPRLRWQPWRAVAVSVDIFRQRVADFIRTTLHPSERAGLIAALVVGSRNDMQAGDWEVLLATGTIHLVAISGLHIGLVAAFMWLLGGWAWRFAGRLPLFIPAPTVGVLVGLLAGLAYALLAGMTIPTQRAVCMLAVVAVALLCQRRAVSSATLLVALASVLAVDPLAPLAAGLWLSFGAVAILLWGAARSYAARFTVTAPSLCWGIGRQLKIWSSVQIVLFIGMLPLLLTLFQQVSLLAPFANLIAIPILGMITVPLALLGLTLYALGLELAAGWAFQGSLFVLEVLWVLLEWLAALPGSVWRQASPPLWSLPLAAVGVLLLLSGKALPARSSGLLWLLPLFSTPPTALSDGEFKYSMLEVGHGLASVVQTANHVLVYDAGPRFASGLDAGAMVVAPFLQQLGVHEVDVLMVSHGDNDHLGGHRALLERFTVARMLTSKPSQLPAERSGATANPAAQKCLAGQNWVWDAVRFEVLSPATDFRNDNDASCVLKVSSEFGSLLLTGDIGKAAERWLVEAGLELSVDILQVPHHGSKTSSTENFLRHTRPSMALASVGYLNRYAHPHAIVRERYARHRIPLYRTAEEGAMTVHFSTAGIHLHGERAARQKYWLQSAKQLTQQGSKTNAQSNARQPILSRFHLHGPRAANQASHPHAPTFSARR